MWESVFTTYIKVSPGNLIVFGRAFQINPILFPQLLSLDPHALHAGRLRQTIGQKRHRMVKKNEPTALAIVELRRSEGISQSVS